MKRSDMHSPESPDDRAETGEAAETWDEDQDPVRALHDTEEGAGDEAGLVDLYTLDVREAEERGVALDPTGGQEPRLD